MKIKQLDQAWVQGEILGFMTPPPLPNLRPSRILAILHQKAYGILAIYIFFLLITPSPKKVVYISPYF